MDQVTTIAGVIARIQTEGGRGNFAIVQSGDATFSYVQVAAAAGSSRLHMEVGTPESFTEAQENRLRELGFEAPDIANWWQTIDTPTTKERLAAAETLVSSLLDVHGVDAAASLDVQVNLE